MAARNKLIVPGAQEAVDQLKIEIANELGVNLKHGYNGDLTSREAGSIGGEMVKKMVAQAANQMQSNQSNQTNQ